MFLIIGNKLYINRVIIYKNIHQYLRSGLAGLILEIYGYLIFAVLSSNDAYYVVWMIDDLIKDIY